MRWLDERTAVSGQIAAGDMDALKAAGVRLIVNNRPDGEEPGQPDEAELRAAAAAIGIGWASVPMAGGVSPAMLDATDAALAGADGPVLAFCRSGTRSTFLWALARVRSGEDPAEVTRMAAAAGYDLTPIASLMERLSGD